MSTYNQEQFLENAYPLAYEEIIKTKAAAAKFIGDRTHFAIINDPHICMINGGTTQVQKEEGKWYLIASGPQWRDQAWTQITEEELITHVYEARKAINAMIREHTRAVQRY
jgi:hypothetical protein